MERSSPKIIKDDHLFVYGAMSTDVSCVTATDCNETSSVVSSSTGSFDFVGQETNSGSSLSEQKNKSPSVLYLFSRYKSLKSDPRSSDADKVMVMETECSSASASPSSSSSELTNSQVLQIS